MSLYVATGGALYVGTNGGGASILENGRFRVVIPPSESGSVLSFFEHDGAVWAVGRAVFRIGPEGPVRVALPGPDPVATASTFLQSYATADGVVVCSQRGLFGMAAGQPVELTRRPTHGHFRDAGGTQWIALGGAGGVAPLEDLESARPAPRIGTIYDSIQVSGDEVLLACTNGIYRAAGSGDALQIDLLTNALQPRVFLARDDGGLWVGTRRHGLASLAPAGFRPLPLEREGEFDPSTGAIAANAQGSALIGSIESQEAWIFDGETTSPVPGVRTVIRDRIMDSAPLADGSFLALDPFGLARIDAEGAQRVLSFEDAFGVRRLKSHLLPGPSNTVWLGQGGTLVQVKGDGSLGPRVPGVGAPPTYGLAVDDALIALRGPSVLRVDLAGLAEGEPLDPPTEIARIDGALLRACRVDERGDTWITTYGSGLARLTPGGRVDRWSVADGLVDDYLGAVLTARDIDGVPRLWLNSNVGVFAVTFESLDAALASDDASLVTLRIPTPEGNWASGCAIGDDELLFPTVEGVAHVRSSEIRLKRPPPKPVIESILVDGEPYHADGSWSSGASLEVRYVGIDYPISRGVIFQHRLAGFDDEWFDAGTQRFARYARLPRGRYEFQLRARAVDGEWSPRLKASSAVVIQPRWHELTSVRSLAALALLLAAVGFMRFRTRSLQERSRWMEDEIRRRREAEEQLSRSRSEHVAVLEAAHDGILSVDRHWTINFANEAVSELLGRTRETLVGSGLDGAGLGELRAGLAKALRGPEPGVRRKMRSGLDTTVERADGSIVEIEATFAWDGESAASDGVPQRLTIVVRDVTDKRMIVEALRRGEERFRTLFRTIPTPVFVWKPSLQLVDWNDAAASSFGFRDDAASPPVLLDLFPASARIERFRLAIERVLGGTPRVSTVHPARGTAGQDRLYRWAFAPLRQADGTIYSVITLATDITEDEQIAADLEALRAKVVRAEEGERARIARELHDDMSQRLAALALEIQISSGPAVLADEEEVRGVFERVQRGIEEVAQDVHALSRRLHPTVLDDLGLVRAVRSECEQRARRYGVPIEFTDRLGGIQPDAAVALALLRIAQEAVQNACKHASADEIQVELERAPFRSVRLTVHDNGEGFDADSTTAATSNGIGMASMEERARLIGAELSVTSREGRGTSVTVVAPLGAGRQHGRIEGPLDELRAAGVGPDAEAREVPTYGPKDADPAGERADS